MCAFWHTAVWMMGYEFISTLVTDPTKLFETKAILELILGFNNIGILLHDASKFLLGCLPTGTITTWLFQKLDISSNYLYSAAAFLPKTLAYAWLVSWKTVALYITPTVPVMFQPFVNAVVAPAAKTLTFSFLVWLIRIIFGF